jgi:hypothetical protein
MPCEDLPALRSNNLQALADFLKDFQRSEAESRNE